jgi:hypothetical protein
MVWSLWLALLQDQILEIPLVVGRRPGSEGFRPKEPLAIQKIGPSSESVKDALIRGLNYLLKLQSPSGGWVYHPSQRRPGQVEDADPFALTARESADEPLLTSLCCMALRSHETLDPDRIAPAVRRGLLRVLELGARPAKLDYRVWTWSFTLLFLVEERRRTPDERTRGRIERSIHLLVESLLRNQHPGTASANPVLKRRVAPSRGGFFGLETADRLVIRVIPNGPAEGTGIQAGDWIERIDGRKIECSAALDEIEDSSSPGQRVLLRILRAPERAEAARREQASRHKRLQSQTAGLGLELPRDGGWSYYRCAAESCTTAVALFALLEAKKEGAIVAQDAILRGARFLESVRIETDLGEQSYLYHAEAGRGPEGDIRGAVGRAAVCELALLGAGRREARHLSSAVKLFVERRGELDRVLGYPGNHHPGCFGNSAFYFLFAHYFAARACRGLEDRSLRRACGSRIQQALLKHRHEDGTWTDHEAWGRLYGTSMALMAFGELRE